MLLTDFFENVYMPVRLRGKSENSKRLYRLCLVQFGRTLGRPAQVKDLTEDNVLRHLSRRSSVAPATRNKELAELTALWRLASQRKLLDTWPDVQSEHEPERAPIAWLPDELSRLIDAAESMTGLLGQVPASVWWSALIRVTLDTGERISAVRYAKWTWIQGEWLLVPAENRKGKTRDRRYRLADATMESLATLRANCPSGPDMFPWPYCDNYLWTKYKAVLVAADLPSTRKHQLHCLRKTVGSAVYAAGLDPQDALDHSDRRTTQRYLDPRFVRTSQACDVLSDFLANPMRKLKEKDERVG